MNTKLKSAFIGSIILNVLLLGIFFGTLSPGFGRESSRRERLTAEIEKLPEQERALRRLDLLSDCVNVAEASGGTSRFPAGGARICDEESLAVKHIARKLSGTATV